MKKTALIMAGGKGERFWPRSRVNLPKQFLSLTDDGKTMIQLTVERISPLVDIKDVYIATNANYKELVKQQLPGLPEENILCEPIGRNTAPCTGIKSWANQTVQQASQRVMQALGKAAKKNVVRLKYGTRVYLVDESQKDKKKGRN